MNRSTTQKPKFKDSKLETEYKKKKLICDSSLSPHKEHLEDSEDDAGFSGKFTKSNDTDESYVQFKGLEWNALDNLIEHQKNFDQMDTSNNFLYHSYYADVRNPKQDKNTQKNLLSPFPSFLKTPIYRETSTSHKYALPTVQSSGEKSFLEKSSGKLAKNSPTFTEKNDTICFHHYHRERFDNKLCEKHKIQTESELLGSKADSFGCCGQETSGNQGKFNAEPEANFRFSNEFPESDGPLRRPKSAARVPEAGKCLDCFRMNFIQNNPTQRGGIKPFDSEKELQVHDSYMTRNSQESNTRKLSNDNKVREKLVYVVEEEGKEVSQLETDLFSVNEILAIKKDLLELSDFAKKLKKLKEIKKKSDKGKPSAQCQCRPVAEVLVDVNRRIAALEARQEELERGSQRSEKKGDTELESKTTDVEKATTDSPPKTPPVTSKQSAMTSTPSFPKTDMIVSRAEGFSNNSEIVNELMDIRTQLQRLEKRRMAQEVPAEVEPLGDSKTDKKKGHAIAVFSSRTYILTPEKYDKKKESKLLNTGSKKVVDSIDLIPSRLKSEKYENSSKMNRFGPGTKENVANWLKNVTTNADASSHEFGVFVAAETPAQAMKNHYEGFDVKKLDSLTKCRRCAQMKYHEFDSQEQKNRATEKEAEKDDAKHRVPTKEISNKSPAPHLRSPVECKECVMTPSGRILAFSASTKLTADTPPEVCRTPEVSLDNPPRIVRNSFSSSSIPSVLATKEQIKKMLVNEHGKKDEEMTTDFSTSKSLQELTTSTTTKGQKTAINTKKKHVEKSCHHSLKDKKHKENKNELVKKEIEKILRKNFDITTTSTVSSSTGKSNVKKSHDSECCHRSPKRKHRNKVDASSGSAVSESSTEEEESSEDTETDTESSRDKKKKLKEKKKKEKVRRQRERERRERKEKEKQKNYDSAYEKSRKCKLERSSSKKHRSGKSSRRKKESNTDEDEDDEDGQYSEFSVYHYTKKHERNPFASKSGILNPVVYCAAEKKPTCSICGIIHAKCSSPPRHSPPRHSPPRHSPPRHSPPRHSPPRPPPLPMRKCCSEVKSVRSASPPKEKSKCCSSPPKCPTLVQVDVPCPVDCPLKKPTPENDSCTFKNFFKNLRNFAHLPGLGKLGYCDKETAPPPAPEKPMCTLQVEDCSSRCPLKKKPEPIKTCKCVKIFLQSQQTEWPGARPFDGYSEGTDATSYSSDCEEKEKERNCPSSQGSPLYCLNVTESMPCDCAQIIKKKKKREKCVCDKCGNVHKKKRPKKSKKRRRSESESEEEKEDCEHMYEQTHPVVVQADATKKTSIIKNFPKTNTTQKSKSSIFQRIAEVRKLKTCKLKKKIRELKHPHQVKVEAAAAAAGRPPSRGSSAAHPPIKKRCDCDPKWAVIEKRIKHLEEDKKDKKKKKKKKNKGVDDDKRRKKKQAKLKEEELDEKSCTCCTCRKRKRKKRKKEERKRKKKRGEDGKRRKKLSCKKYCKHEIKFHSKYGPHISPSSDTMTASQQSEKDDFLEKCTREKREKRKGEEGSKDTKVVQHATFCCTCDENDTPFKSKDCPEKRKVCGDKSDSSKKKRSFLDRFSSISSLIRNWRNYGRERIARELNATTTNEDLLDDASKSSQYPREKGVNIAEAPIFFKKPKKPKKPKLTKKEKKEVKKEKKETKEKKKKDKKENKEKYKEKYPKSKARLRRHK